MDTRIVPVLAIVTSVAALMGVQVFVWAVDLRSLGWIPRSGNAGSDGGSVDPNKTQGFLLTGVLEDLEFGTSWGLGPCSSLHVEHSSHTSSRGWFSSTHQALSWCPLLRVALPDHLV